MTFTGRFGNKPYAPAIEANPSKPEFPILTPKRKAEKLYLDPLFPKGNKAKSSGAQQTTAPAPGLEHAAQPTYQGGDDGGSGFDDHQRGIAEGYGHTAGEGNIGGLGSLLGAATGIPFIGGLAGKAAEALEGDANYGQYGTYDSQGHVFGNEGRGYNVVSGRAENTYRNRGDYFGGLKDSYSNLRAAGENPISSALGSYDNSIYAHGATSDPATHGAARVSRLRGENAPVVTTAGRISENTFNQDESGFDPITGEQLGFDNSRAFSANQASENTGVWGTGQGDLAATEFGPGVINESGQVEHAGGTVIALTDTSKGVGNNISLLNGPDNVAAQEELARRAAPTPPPVAPPPAPAPEPERDDHHAPARSHNISTSASGSGLAGSGTDHALARAVAAQPAPEPERESDSGGGGGGGGGK